MHKEALRKIDYREKNLNSTRSNMSKFKHFEKQQIKDLFLSFFKHYLQK